MNTEDLIAMFNLVGDQRLYVTLANKAGAKYATSILCNVGVPTEHDSSPLPQIGIIPIGDAGYNTTFPVEKVEKDEVGQVILTGPKGTATFRTVGQ